MAAPSTQMVVSNIGQASFWCSGVEIAPLGSHTYTGVEIPGVCSDVNFWAAFLGGITTVQLNGLALPAGSGPVVAFLVAVAIGDIVPT